MMDGMLCLSLDRKKSDVLIYSVDEDFCFQPVEDLNIFQEIQ